MSLDPVTASFTHSPTSGAVNLEVVFTNTGATYRIVEDEMGTDRIVEDETESDRVVEVV